MNTKKKIERKYTEWEKALGNLLTKMSEDYLIDDEFESQLKWFISDLLQAQQERIVGEIEKMKLSKPGKHEWCERGANGEGCGCDFESYNKALDDILSTIKRKKGGK